MRLLYYIILAFLVLFDTSCTNEINVQLSGPLPEGGQVSGRIVLPANIKIDTTGLEVLTAVGGVTPVNAGYAIDTSGKTSTTLLMNKAGDVVLMGYNYPGQMENNLSSESTALALLMNTLTLRSLSEAGKLEVIGKIKADPNYKTLVNEISGSLAAGKAVTDTTNTKLIGAMAALFRSSSSLRVTTVQSFTRPVTIKTANTELLLQNNNVAHSYVAGIYKDGKNVGYYTIDGRTLFATSLTDVALGLFGDGYGIPEPVQYTMEGDGEFTVKIRSGKPGFSDGSIESNRAFRENINEFIIEQILEFAVEGLGDCAKSSIEGIKGFTETILDNREAVLSNAKSPEVIAAFALDLTGEVLSNSREIIKDCGKVTPKTYSFFSGIGKLFAVLKVATKFMVGANVTAHTNDLFQAIPAIDTCFQIIGLKTFKCGEQPTYFVEPISGINQKGDANKELAEPLKVKVSYDDGKPAAKTTVHWVIKSGGGKVGSGTSATNNVGIAEIKWTLGSSGGEQSVEAYVNKKAGSKSTVFKATAATGAAHKIEILLNSDEGYSNPLQVKVTDINGKPVPSIEIEWRKLTGMELRSFDRFSNDQGIAEAFMVLDEPVSGPSMEVAVKNDESKFVTFAPQELMVGAGYYFYNYIQPGVDRNAMPNPVKIFITDRYFIPQPSSNALRITVKQATDDKLVAEGPGQSGILNILRPNPTLTTYKIEVTQNGKTVSSWSNIVIK